MIETIRVENLEVLCKIGIYEWEHGQLQKLQIDLELGNDFSRVIGSRHLADTIDYVDLCSRVESLLQGKNFGYLEVVVEKVTDLVFETYPATSFTIRLRKFVRDIPNAAHVGVMRSISRTEWAHKRKLRATSSEPLPVVEGRDLEGRVALVTGSVKRLGRGLAEHLASRGASVAIHYRESRDEAERVAAALRTKHPSAKFGAFGADLGKRSELADLGASVARELGVVDVLVNNVGHYVPKGILDVDPAEWETTLRVNLDGVFHLTRAVVDRLIATKHGFGRVVNIGHAGAQETLGRPFASAYHVTKHAIAQLTRTFAEACGPHGITVNLLNPGILEISVDMPIEVEEIPLRRLGTVADLVGGLAYLTSPAAAYVNGATLDVCGGYGLSGRP